ncbi:putative isomerase YbhE [Testicularia cyperi]|uniref:Putative isomerase YbhE n=1 Tax=Testicularia cyperi TaxID=1882483 RepID=A0A317XJ98_9BASI|nr:putative isomerase YbhE [Testicularia cyperi]
MPTLAVGTFNTDELFTVEFDPSNEKLQLVGVSKARGNHSWLSIANLSDTKADQSAKGPAKPTHLYATCWTEPPSVAAYRIVRNQVSDTGASPDVEFQLINTAETAARSGYVYVGFPAQSENPVLYTVGGPTGEVIGIDRASGGFDLSGAKHRHCISSVACPTDTVGKGVSGRIQELDFVDGECSLPGHTLSESRSIRQKQTQAGAVVDNDSSTTSLDTSGGKNAMDFGGLRHGSHGIDISPDGTLCYVPDIGRNCVWTYKIDQSNGALTLAEKSIAPRKNDGPRHTISHPAGRFIYSLQEHSAMVDVFEVQRTAQGEARLQWRQGFKVIPQDDDAGRYWADEVRVSCDFPHVAGSYPKYLFASTRGLTQDTKGWVAVFELDRSGLIVEQHRPENDPKGDALDLWETPTSGGWANAIEPAPHLMSGRVGDAENKVQYAVLTDSEAGVVRMLRLDTAQTPDTESGGATIRQVATLELGHDSKGRLREAATAVWI